jgi:hypothetical protein
MPSYERKRILVVVKTYPTPSRSYIETVCCAGVDLDTGTWMRMYPITFRQLAGRQFAKFQRITCMATRSPKDTRPESWKIDQDSIELDGAPMSAGALGWPRRMALLPKPAKSFDEIEAARAANGTSLGMFRPRQVLALQIYAAEPWDEKQKAHLRQQRLELGAEQTRQLNELEQIPWKFRYRFTCDDDACAGEHELTIIDWEIGAAYRNWRRDYGETGWEAKLREKFELELPASDLHFVVGNMAAHPQVFMIVGLVRPPRSQVDGSGVQERLQLVGEQRPVTGVRVGLKAEQADTLGGHDGEESLEFFPDEP